jgi:hypothetical protein
VTATCHGIVTTAHASRYLQQLCKHWSHKYPVEFSPERGVIDLPRGRVAMAAAPERLDLTLSPASDGEAATLRQVVEDHLNRFAFREAPLAFAWDEGEASQ